jgi:hypothetical protein
VIDSCIGMLVHYLRSRNSRGPLTRSFGIEKWDQRQEHGYGFYWDAAKGFVLLCDDKPFACIGFDAWMDRIEVQQVQGAFRQENFFLPFSWEHLLLECVISYARLMRYSAVYVRSASINRWVGKESPEAFRRRMVKRYDETALALGFTPTSDDRFVLRIT